MGSSPLWSSRWVEPGHGGSVTSPLPWWESLDFLAPDCREDYGRLLSLLEKGGLGRSNQTSLEEPSGWSGIERRGAWERLVPSEWALAETHREEFLRRADQGELAFWETGQETNDSARSVWVWVDVGPDQLGACRVVQLAVLLWLQRACFRSGGRFYWGVIQSPEKGYEKLGAEEFKTYLSERSLDPPRRPAESMECEENWCIGSSDWVSQAPERFKRVSLRQIDSLTVELKTPERRILLPLPADRHAVRLLRDPLVWKLSHNLRSGNEPTGDRFKFSVNGRRLILVDKRDITLIPIPSSINEPAGTPHCYRLPWESRVIACSLERRTINIVLASQENWVFLPLNPAQADMRNWITVKAPQTDHSQLALGECWKSGEQWMLCLENQMYKVEGKNLVAVSDVRGYFPSGDATILANSQGELLNAQGERFHNFGKLHPKEVFLLPSFDPHVQKSGCAIAYHVLGDWWRILYRNEGLDILVDGKVVGLHHQPHSEPALLVNRDGILFLQGSESLEALELGEPMKNCVTHRAGLLAFQTHDGRVGCYDITIRSRLSLVRS